MDAIEFKAWRDRLGQTQQQIADRLGVSRTTIQNWESGTAIPQSVETSCKVWEHRIRQEDPGLGPLTLIYSDGPMFVDPYGPRRRLAMMQQEPYPTNAAVLARVQQLTGRASFHNPFVLAADQSPLWNAPELARVISGEDHQAPTLVNMLRAIAKIVRDNSAHYVRSGPKVPSPSEIEARQSEIIAQAHLLEKIAGDNLFAIVRDMPTVEKVFEQLRSLGTKAPDYLVSGIAFARSVFERYPLMVPDNEIIEDGTDLVLHYKGYEGRFPKIPIFPNKWVINLSSNDRLLFTKIGGNAVIEGSTRDEALVNAKLHVDDLA